MTAVGMAVLETLLAPGFLDGVTAKGRQLAEGLAALSRKHRLGEVRGRGLLMALDLDRDAGAKVAEQVRANGLLLNSPRPNSLRFMPALTVSAGEIEQMLAGLDGALADVLGQ
jgi:acetylornithine/N-succinyldiaminopimelate aminotransferase